MILRDFYCERCGTIQADKLVESVATSYRSHCAVCGDDRAFFAIITAPKNRVRINDFPAGHDPWWKGHVQRVGTPDACHDEGTSDERPALTKGGAPIKLNEDRSAERRDKLAFNSRQKYGQSPVFIDGGKR